MLAHEPRPADGLRLAAAVLRLWGRGRLGRVGGPARVVITSPRGGRVALALWTYIDVLVAREIFLDDEYALPEGLQVESILDLGSNTGISIGYFRDLFPAAEIVAVEPDPRQLGPLRASVGAEVAVLPFAVADRSGPASFYSRADGWASSLLPGADTARSEVRCVTVPELLALAGRDRFDLVKIDVEGAEWGVLDQLTEITDTVVGELHHDGPTHTLQRAREAFAGWRFDASTAGATSSFVAERLSPGA